MKTLVEIQVAQGGATRHALDGGPVSLGAGKEVGVRIEGATDLLPHHLDLSPSGDGVRVDVTEGAPRGVLFAGREHRSIAVPWGEEVYLGNVRLCFLREQAAKKGPGPVVLAASVLLFALLGAASMTALEPPAASSREVEAPPLPSGKETCPPSDPRVAEHRAREAERAAVAKAQRFAFAVGDGVEALRLYAQSRSCFDRIGLAGDAARVGGELESWAGRMNDEYASARLRLRVALDHDLRDDALAATAELEALLAGCGEGPYLEWLSSVRRELERKAPRKGS